MAPAKFIGELFKSRDTMHIAHLQTTSFAEHKALGAYYDQILDLTDSFTEKYFGSTKRVELIIPESRNESANAHMQRMKAMIEAERDNYSTDLQNIMDEMLGLVHETMYLLTLV
jgi:hypothetical protein